MKVAVNSLSLMLNAPTGSCWIVELVNPPGAFVLREVALSREELSSQIQRTFCDLPSHGFPYGSGSKEEGRGEPSGARWILFGCPQHEIAAAVMENLPRVIGDSTLPWTTNQIEAMATYLKSVAETLVKRKGQTGENA